MKIEIDGQPVFWFTLTDEQMAVLELLSSVHYDGVCKDATKLGGFIYGWKNARLGAADAKLKASFREIDTCLKILEGLNHPPVQMPIEEHRAGLALVKSFRAALARANKETQSWSLEIEA